MKLYSALLALSLSGVSAWAADSTTTTVSVLSEKTIGTIPANFIGLSYEKSAVTENHFRPDNLVLVNLHKNLGSGVLRFGGNKVELTQWSREAPKEKPAKGVFVATTSDMDKFYAFIKSIDWRVIHAVNLASNKPINYAVKIGGNSIMGFEIGNEPDHYDKDTKKLREKGYAYPQYKSELEKAQSVILKQNPGINLIGPATTSGGFKFFEPCVTDFKNKLFLSTSHFYPTSAISVPAPTCESLLSDGSKKKTIAMADKHFAAAKKAGVPWRLAECNSASMGGTDGVSDVFAAAVWGSDFLFDVAEHGATGVNLHTIFGQHGYTAISYDKDKKTYAVRPLYYSLLLFKDAGNGKLIEADTKSTGNVVSHATLSTDGKLRVIIINKELDKATNAAVLTNSKRTHGTITRLSASSPTEQMAVSYGEGTVNKDGTWKLEKREDIKGSAGRFEVALPACSAAVLTLEVN
ncbi:MAG: hypothetical protein EBU50_01755 [Opitutae bacterium]|nr:hypothetical protein [Opitutae bacterium]